MPCWSWLQKCTDIITRQWGLCLGALFYKTARYWTCSQRSCQRGDEKLGAGFRASADHFSSLAAGFHEQGLIKACVQSVVWCLEKPRIICQHRKGELPSGFLAFKTDGPRLHSKCFLGSSGWPSGTQDLDFLPEHTAACPFCGLSGQWPALWAAVMVDLLSGWSMPSDSWDILSSFMGWLDESAIRSFNNWSPPIRLGLCTFIHSFCTQPFIRLTGIY